MPRSWSNGMLPIRPGRSANPTATDWRDPYMMATATRESTTTLAPNRIRSPLMKAPLCCVRYLRAEDDHTPDELTTDDPSPEKYRPAYSLSAMPARAISNRITFLMPL